ncbi:MAG: hypothetical protein JWR74_413 [Polaromonas sp.]|nr:hypothetical protein [Polaromonas sp.]
MFNLAPTETFKAPVTVNVAQPGGGWKQESFTGEFKRTDEDRREELLALKNVELVREVLVGWSMKDEQRNDVPFTPENLDAFCRLTGAVRETTLAYWQHNVGAKAKN